ncbi:MAG: hypothetical protein JJ975_11465 [Bacteroidia bacterium]|nr:hypothetical protein [Bacteroidia bacterium]
MRYASLLILMLCGSMWSHGQSFKERFSYRGYLKDMRVLSIVKDTSGTTQTLQQNLIHHRLNTRLQLDTSWQLGVEFRNRVFYGEFLKYAPGFGDQLSMDPGLIDMSWSWINKPNLISHTTIDRLWVNYSTAKWDVRLGRQRINWGQNVVWNPNDLFNVLNYTDFDYEERPGSDAFKAERFFKKGRSFQVAYKFTEDFDDAVFAAMYKFNKKNYDVQILAGKYNRDVALGVGWAGNIKSSGFKGESTYFHPIDDTAQAVVLTTFSWDMSFGNGMYLLVSGLHNSNGTNDLDRLNALSAAGGGSQLTLKNLMPNKYSLFAQVSGAFNPLWSGNIGSIVALDLGGVFAMPSIAYSIKQNLDLSLVGQSFIGLVDNKLQSISNAVFLRFKWSY